MDSTELDPLYRPLRIICTLDPAVDHLHSKLVGEEDSYAATRDLKYVSFLPGQVPHYFTVRALTPSDFVAIDMEPSSNVKAIRAFMFSVVQIENYPVPGNKILPRQSVPDPNKRGGKRWIFGPDEINELGVRLGMRWIYEIGMAAYQRALEGNAAGGSVPFTLPPSSLEELERIARRLAEQIPEDAPTTSSGGSLNSSPMTPEQTSDDPTDATVRGVAGSSPGTLVRSMATQPKRSSSLRKSRLA